MAARTKLGCGGSPTLRTAESRTTPITIDACGAWHPISTRSPIGGVLGHKSAPPTYGGAVMQLHEATLNQGVLVGSTQESHRNELIDGMSCISGRRTDINTFILKRQADVVVSGEGDDHKERRFSNGEINRELTTLERIFNLARQNGKLTHARTPRVLAGSRTICDEQPFGISCARAFRRRCDVANGAPHRQCVPTLRHVSALDLKDAARRLDASRAYSALTGDRAIAPAGVSVTRPPVLCPAIYSRRLSLRQQ